MIHRLAAPLLLSRVTLTLSLSHTGIVTPCLSLCLPPFLYLRLSRVLPRRYLLSEFRCGSICIRERHPTPNHTDTHPHLPAIHATPRPERQLGSWPVITAGLDALNVCVAMGGGEGAVSGAPDWSTCTGWAREGCD